MLHSGVENEICEVLFLGLREERLRTSRKLEAFSGGSFNSHE